MPKPTKPGFGGFDTMPLGIFSHFFSTDPETIQITLTNYPGPTQEEPPCTDIFHVLYY